MDKPLYAYILFMHKGGRRRHGRMSQYIFFISCLLIVSLIGNICFMGQLDKLEREIERLKGEEDE